MIGGPKFRARQGTVQSADWSALLAPFGVIKVSSPGDRRLLVDVPKADIEEPAFIYSRRSDDKATPEPVAAFQPPDLLEELTLEMAKDKMDATLGIMMSGSAQTGVVVIELMSKSPGQMCGA